MHWYPYAAARYPIAHSSEFAIPGELIPNFLQLAARCRGTITVSESSCAIFASAENQIAASWRKSKAANTVPQFSEPANAAVTLDTIRMLIAVSILAAFTENVRLTYAHDDNRRFLLLTADFKGLPLTARIPFSSTDARNFDCIVKTKDLALACCRLISNEHFSLKFTERFASIEDPATKQAVR